MSLEKYSNGAATTLSANVNGTSDPVTITVTSASSFPGIGDFRIKIDSEILLVTTVSGNNFTCSRAQEGTTIAAHTAPAAVTHILTAASLKRIIGEFNIVDTFANRPTASVKGRRFIANDGPGGYWIDNGTSWDLYFNDIGPLNPNISDFTTAINGTARWTLDTSKGIPQIKDAGPATGSEFNMGQVKTAPSTPWTMILAQHIISPPGSDTISGIVVRDSATGHLKGFSRNCVGERLFVFNWTNFTTFSSTPIDTGTNVTTGHDVDFLKLVNDGINLGYWWSSNFRDWFKVGSEAVSGNFVANIDQVGYFTNTKHFALSNTSGGGATFYHAVCG